MDFIINIQSKADYIWGQSIYKSHSQWIEFINLFTFRWRYLAYPAMKGTKNQLKACIAVADSALSANSARAKLTKEPLSAREFDGLLEDTLRDRVFPFCRMPEVQVDPYEILTAAAPAASASGSRESRAMADQMKQMSRQLESIVKSAGAPGPAKPTRSSGASKVCNQFNLEKGCPRNPSGASCSLPNGPLIHSCNFKTKQGLCGMPHPRHGNH